MQRVFLFASVFLVTPCVLVLALVLFAWHSYTLTTRSFATLPNNIQTDPVVYAAVPNQQTQIAGGANAQDARVQKLASFFANYGSVLGQYAQTFIVAADEHNLDYRLLPAIAMQESIGCKREIPGTHNCWGWGIYKGKTTTFDTYDQAINTISKLIAKDYAGKGLNTPEEMQKVYNPTNTSDWTTKINYFINQIQNTI